LKLSYDKEIKDLEREKVNGDETLKKEKADNIRFKEGIIENKRMIKEKEIKIGSLRRSILAL